MATIDNSDAIKERLPSQFNHLTTKIFNCFNKKTDVNLDDPSHQTNPGLHVSLKNASGVDRRQGGKQGTMTPAQRATWDQQIRSARENANKQLVTVRRSRVLSLKLNEVEQELAKIRLEDPRLKQSLEYFQGDETKETRALGIQMIMEDLLQSPELIIGLMQAIAPEQSIAQSKIDDALAFGKDKEDLAHERIEAAEKLQKQIQNNAVVLKEAEWNIKHLVRGLRTLQEQKDGVEQSCRSEVEEARQERRLLQDRFENLQRQCHAKDTSLNQLQARVNSLEDEKIKVATAFDEALRSKQDLEQLLQSNALQSVSDTTIISQLRAEVKRQNEVIDIGAKELAQVRKDHGISQGTINDLKNERDGLRTSLTTLESEKENYKSRYTTAEAERDNFKAKYTTAEAKFAGLQSDVEEIVGERDEVKQRLAMLANCHNKVIVFADIWKITMEQTGEYSPQMFGSMRTSLTAVEAFRLNLSLEDIRPQPLPVSRVYGIDEADPVPTMRLGYQILSLFGQIHTSNCRVPLKTIGEISQTLATSDVRPRRLELLLLYAFLRKRCALVQESTESCTLAASLVILRCIELLQCHLASTPLLELITEVLDGIKEKLKPDSLLVRAIVDRLTLKDRSLAQTLISFREFITIPGSNCKVCMDHDMLVAIRADQDVAYIRPCFFRLQSDFVGGYWNFAFNEAPMFGSWKTPPWEARTHTTAVLTVLDSAFARLNSSESLVEAGLLEHELVDVVMA